MSLSQASRPGARPIPLLKGALGAAVALAALSLSTGSAQAACASGTPAGTCRVTVGGLQYDVTLYTGSYNAKPIYFQTAANGGVMPWWGSSSTANAFATAVGYGLGNVNGFNYQEGPFFGYANSIVFGNPAVTLAEWNDNVQNPPGISIIQTFASANVGWAQATLYTPLPVDAPGPLPLFGAGAAFGFSRQLRKRIQGSRLQVSSSQPRA